MYLQSNSFNLYFSFSVRFFVAFTYSLYNSGCPLIMVSKSLGSLLLRLFTVLVCSFGLSDDSIYSSILAITLPSLVSRPNSFGSILGFVTFIKTDPSKTSLATKQTGRAICFFLKTLKCGWKINSVGS